ncbi:MAG: hypothetical protein JKY25_06030 [Robiginitomaculum sp.]|nr:hypothetical protein [Robiginitomaculum sp.]
MMRALTIGLRDDLLRTSTNIFSIEEHQKAAIKWLKHAHDMSSDDGVSYGYYLRGRPFSSSRIGWRSSYIETSGYITETFYDVSKRYNDKDSANRAEKIGRWLLTVQNNDGSFSNANYDKSNGIIFDTGQVLFGLIRCYKETKDSEFLAAAQKAAQWLFEQIDLDGAWRNNTHLNGLHTYNTRVAWAMLEYCQVSPDVDIKNAARNNLRWALSQQMENGLFDNCGFKSGHDPFTHTIAYTIRGLFEGGLLLKDETFVVAAKKAADRMAGYVGEKGFLPGRISAAGTPHNGSACLTGNCQMAIIWYKMSKVFGSPALADTAKLALDYALATQNLRTGNDNIRGAVKGSHPIWGRYTPMAYPNWATKFLIDAILLRQEMPPS